MQETWVQSQGQEDPLEKGNGNPASSLAWETSWTEQHSRLQSVGLQEYDTTEQVNYVFPSGSVVKNPPAMQETWVQSLGQEDPLEKGKGTHSSILA